MDAYAANLRSSGADPVGRPGAIRVLLAEDSAIIQELTSLMLTSLGCTVKVAEDGVAALEALYLDEYDLVLMDCQMPELDGLGATRAVRREEQRAGGSKRIPIIALTADDAPGDRERCLTTGMDDFLKKPFSQSQLQCILQRWAPQGTVGAPVAATTQVVTETIRAGEAGHTPKSPAAIESKSVIDRTVVQQLEALQPKLFEQLAKLYLRDAPKLVAGILQSAKEGDARSLLWQAHKLKSSSASLGALGLSELCRTAESAARAEELSPLGPTVSRLETEFEAVAQEISRIVGGNTEQQTALSSSRSVQRVSMGRELG